MCKRCGNDPYLAGELVFVLVRTPMEWVDELDETTGYIKRHKVPIWDRQRALIGRCAGHHNGWVRVRWKSGIEYVTREENVLAYAV